MSAGPIQRERDAWKPPVVSTDEGKRICLQITVDGRARGYCGRRSSPTTTTPTRMNCADCTAAVSAGQHQARSTP